MIRVVLAFALLCAAPLAAPAQGAKKPAPAEALAAANTSFGVALYHRVRADHKGNLFFSPVSLTAALGLAAAGARGDTRQQMLDVLRVPPEKIDGLGAFSKGMALKNPRGTHVELANGLWAHKGVALEPGFLRAGRDAGAQVENLDFAGNVEPSRAAINGWVEKRTHGRIKDLLPAGSVSRHTKLVLASAVHFKGDWEHPFRKEATKDAEFHGLTDRVRVPMMHQQGEFGHAHARGMQALEMPFAGGELGMLFLLPDAKGGLAELEKDLSAARLTAWVRSLESKRVDVHLPRFGLAVQYPLGAVLTKMGMKEAFGPKGDFSGVSKTPGLHLSEAFHRAYVNVNEQGSEAGAATAVAVTPKSVEGRVPAFRADRPFVFLVRDRRTGVVLFLGRLAQPKV